MPKSPAFDMFAAKQSSVAVVGLGYVGLPLAISLSRHFSVLGLDLSETRIEQLQAGYDRTREVDSATLAATTMRFSSDPSALAGCGVIIVAVPTPIDRFRNPDLACMEGASRTVGQNMAKGTVVVYESTVYPGVTEDVCAPILEKESGLKLNQDFFLGYSPERINPGDKVHTVDKITKIVSGSTLDTLDLLARIYGSIVTAGIHRASSIKVAEAAKVIENTQRDINIALMNELSLIFDRMGIDTLEVLEAAGTKWNFLPFRPGLVGGHCIGVDPYYLTHKAEELGYHPEVILAGRRINDTMGHYVAQKAVKMLIASGCMVNRAKVGLFGLTFKENVPDLRNTRVVDIKAELEDYGITVLVHDPLADPAEAMHEYGVTLTAMDDMRDLDAAILAVNHEAYSSLTLKELRTKFSTTGNPILLDLKGHWSQQEGQAAGFTLWRL